MTKGILAFKTWLIKEVLAKSNCSYQQAIDEVKDFVYTDEGQRAFKKWQAVQPTVKEKYNHVKHIRDCLNIENK